MKSRSQASLEILFAFAIILALFIVVILFLYNKDSETTSTANFLDKRNLCLEISNNINNVYTNGDGAIVRLDDTKYDIEFNGDERSVFVDDVFCSIPIKEITNGVDNKFTIPPGIVQMENRDNVVYILTNCIPDVPKRAVATSRDPNNPIVVTNLVKKDDDNFAEVFLPHIFSFTISNKSKWIEENDIRIAYVKLGVGCTENKLFEALDQDFGCNDYSGILTFCDFYKNQNDINDLFDKDYQKNYTVMIFEDADLDNNQTAKLEAATPNSKWLLITGSFYKENTPSKLIFDIEFLKNNANADGPAYVKNYTDFFLQLIPGSTFYPTVNTDMKSVNNTNNITDYTQIANFSKPGVDAMAKWFYGDGTIYYISRLSTSGTGKCDDRLTGNLTDAITKLIGAYAIGNLNAEFELTGLLGGQFEPNESRIYFSHKEESINMTIINVTYSDKNGLFTACEDINGTTSERLDNCPHTSKEIKLNTTINFRANIHDIKKSAFVDVNYIETCFNPDDIFS